MAALTFSREQIEATGAVSVADFLQTLPQIFGGGPTDHTVLGAEAQSNVTLGTGVNLRGLGAGATVVLVNGQRIAASGTGGGFVDVSNIPLTAVQEIQIVPFASSMRYGADAIGGVVNFIMREGFQGAETVLTTGTGTQGDLGTRRVCQTSGYSWGAGSVLLSAEYYRRDALPASDRRYAASNLVPLGGGDFDSPFTNPGNISAGGQSWAIPAKQDGTHLSATSLAAGTENLQNKYSLADILPQQGRWSLYASGRQSFAERLDLFGSVLVSARNANERLGGLGTSFAVPVTNPFYVNPTGPAGPVRVLYNFGDDLGAETEDIQVGTVTVTQGVNIQLASSWRLGFSGTYAQEHQQQTTSGLVNYAALAAALADSDPATAFNPFGDGSHTNPQTLQSIASVSRVVMDSELRSAGLTTEGPLLRLPGGDTMVALGIERRTETYSAVSPGILPDVSLPSLIATRLSRGLAAGFAEWTVPIFGAEFTPRAARRLEATVAARYEDYNDVGHAVTPLYGLVWAPVEGLAVRATWSRLLRPPPLGDLDDSHNVLVAQPLPDARSPGGSSFALLWAGNNAGLHAERATSWTSGLDLAFERIAGLSVGLTYFDTVFRDRIDDRPLTADILTNPAYSDAVIRNPDPALIDQICHRNLFYLGTTADCSGLAVQALVDLRIKNLQTLRTSGFDISAHWEDRGARGRFQYGLDGTYLLAFSQQEGTGVPAVSLLNTQHNPINLRFRGVLSWDLAALGATALVNFANGYRDTASTPARPVAAVTTCDLQLRYGIGGTPSENDWLHDMEISLSAINVFNTQPPFLNNGAVGLGYDQENGDPSGRRVMIEVRVRW